MINVLIHSNVHISDALIDAADEKAGMKYSCIHNISWSAEYSVTINEAGDMFLVRYREQYVKARSCKHVPLLEEDLQPSFALAYSYIHNSAA